MWLRMIYILKMSKYLEVSISISTDSLPTSYRQITNSRPSVDRQIAKTMEKTVGQQSVEVSCPSQLP